MSGLFCFRIVREGLPKGSFLLLLISGIIWMKHTKVLMDTDYFGTERIGRILLNIAPPVMLAQLIQALYNIVDSFFVGRYSVDALTALSVIYPLQLILIALAVGTGVGVNTYMARKYAQNRPDAADKAAGTGMVLELLTWAVIAVTALLIMRPYVLLSAKSDAAVNDAICYGNIVSAGSIGLFLEGNWTKVHQARGNMRLPMIAQIIGAIINIAFDPLLIFGIGIFPGLGVAGAAYATILGQIAAAVITAFGAVRRPPALRELPHYIGRIYYYGYSSIVMQSLYTVYILGLNIILAGFSDAAVTVLGLYYKLQSFFFIPLFGLQVCIVPVLSFNYTRRDYKRCREIMKDSLVVSAGFMIAGIIAFVLFPDKLISVFSDNAAVAEAGRTAFPIIGSSFIPAAVTLMMPVFFQAIGNGMTSMMLSIIRQLFCLVPIFKLFSLLGLDYAWFSFPVSEIISGTICVIMYIREIRKW